MRTFFDILLIYQLLTRGEANGTIRINGFLRRVSCGRVFFRRSRTKFTEGDDLDVGEIERCFGLQFDAGCDGMIVCGSLGEAMALEPEEKLELLGIAKSVAGSRPVLMTVCESSTRRAAKAAQAAAKAGADGLMVLPGVPYKSAPHETVRPSQGRDESRGPACDDLQ